MLCYLSSKPKYMKHLNFVCKEVNNILKQSSAHSKKKCIHHVPQVSGYFSILLQFKDLV